MRRCCRTGPYRVWFVFGPELSLARLRLGFESEPESIPEELALPRYKVQLSISYAVAQALSRLCLARIELALLATVIPGAAKILR